jgi:mannose-6-phosphate isomerase-like protein (cupin superfamily)
MTRREEEMRSEVLSEMRGGTGDVQVFHILEKPEMKDTGRLFARNILKPGTSIGIHEHKGDFEVYYIAKGSGIFHDNGTDRPVKSGDVGLVPNGSVHGIRNTGTEDMEVIAVVLYDNVIHSK